MAKTSSEPQLSIIVPAFNEEKTIQNVLEALDKSLPKGSEVIVVDDGSSDGTVAIVEKFAAKHKSVRLIRQPQNRGKTAALVTGFAQSRGGIVIVQDADLEYDPAEIAEVIAPILSNRADVVYGSRFLIRRASRVLYYRHYLANRFLTGLSNLLTDLNFTDVETCYKALPRGDHPQHAHHLQRLRFRGRGDRQDRQAGLPHLRGAHLLLRAYLPGGQEDRAEGRLPRALLHLQIQPLHQPEDILP